MAEHLQRQHEATAGRAPLIDVIDSDDIDKVEPWSFDNLTSRKVVSAGLRP
jgi:hypothetical protein